MPIRFTSPTYPAALIKTLNDHHIGLDKKGRGPYQITVKSAHAQAIGAGMPALTSEQTKDLLNSLETDTVVEILDIASTKIASTVVEQLPSNAILDIGKGLQRMPNSAVKQDKPHCTLLGSLPRESRVLLRKDLSDKLKDQNVSISAITSRFHGKLIGVVIDPDNVKPMNSDKIASINLSSDCFVYLNDALPDMIIIALGKNQSIRNFDVTQLSVSNCKNLQLSLDCFVYLKDAMSDEVITALGMNQSIRNFDVTQLSVSNCEKLQGIIEGRDHIVELRCNTAEQRDVFHNKPGVTILMPGAIQSNPLAKDSDAALALLGLQRQNNMEGSDDHTTQSSHQIDDEPIDDEYTADDSVVDHMHTEGSDDPQAQPVTLSRKSRLSSPDSIGDHIHEDASSDSEHANNKRQRRMTVTPDQEESDVPAKGDDETTRPNRLREDDAIDDDDSIDYAVSDHTWRDDDASDEDEYTDDASEPTPKRPK